MADATEAAAKEALADDRSFRAMLQCAWLSIILIAVPLVVFAAGFSQTAVVPLLFAVLLCLPYLWIALPIGGPVERRLENAVQAGTAGMLIAGITTVLILIVAVTAIGRGSVEDFLVLFAVVAFWGSLTALHVGLRRTGSRALRERGVQSVSRARRALGTGGVLLYQVVILTVAGNILPSTTRRLEANEASALGSVRVIHVAAVMYEKQYGNGFPAGLAVLGAPLGSGDSSRREPSCNQADLIDALLAEGQKAGYIFTYTPGPPVEKPAEGCPPGVQNFTVTARPLVYDTTGKRSFWTDQVGVVHQTTEDRPATASDPPVD